MSTDVYYDLTQQVTPKFPLGGVTGSSQIQQVQHLCVFPSGDEPADAARQRDVFHG